MNLMPDPLHPAVDHFPIVLILLGAVVDCAQDGAEARWAVENGSYEAVVLDIMMPQVDGVSLDSARQFHRQRGARHPA
jgi:DNA-binding response OmpR family regulator